MQKVFIAPRAWLRKIDPAVPNSFTLAWLVDDLFIYGRSFLYITSRTADGYPASFTRLPANLVQTLDQPGPIELARCLVFATAMVSKPANVGKPTIIYSNG